jgi:hypothetical protein
MRDTEWFTEKSQWVLVLHQDDASTRGASINLDHKGFLKI